MEADALFRQHQLFQPGVLRHALALDVALALHQLQDVGHGGAGNGKLPLNVPLEHLLLPVPVKIPDDPTVHRGGLFHTVGAGKLVDLAEDQVVHPADLGRDDLRLLPGRIPVVSAFVLFFVTHTIGSF